MNRSSVSWCISLGCSGMELVFAPPLFLWLVFFLKFSVSIFFNTKCMKSWKRLIFMDLMFSNQVNSFFFFVFQLTLGKQTLSVHHCLQLFDSYHSLLEEADFVTDLIFIPIIKLYSPAFSVWKAHLGDLLRWGGNEVTGCMSCYSRGICIPALIWDGSFSRWDRRWKIPPVWVETGPGETVCTGHQDFGSLPEEKFNHCTHIIHPPVARREWILHVVTKTKSQKKQNTVIFCYIIINSSVLSLSISIVWLRSLFHV